MKISVIIPCFNSEDTLGEQLDALAAQRFSGPWEVIVADNGSTDRSVEIARSFRDRLPELVLLDASARRGAAYARNFGAMAARSEFLAFCDSDDVVGDGYLEAVFRALQKFEFIACRYEYGRLNRRWISRLPGVQLNDVERGLFGPFAYAGGGSLAVRKSAHDRIGGFDEENFLILQDTDYCIRLQQAGVSLAFVPDAVVHYRWRETVREAFAQARNWGREVVGLRVRYWPMERPEDARRYLYKHIFEIVRVRNRSQLAHWIWAAGWRLGTDEGWREEIRVRLGEGDGKKRLGSRFFRRIISKWLATAGRVFSRLKRFHDRSCSEVNRFGFAHLDEKSVLEHPIKIDGREYIHIGSGVKIASGGWLYAVSEYRNQRFSPEIHVGDRTVIGRFGHIVATQKIQIGKNVTLGSRVYMSDNLHDYRDTKKTIAENRLISCGEIAIGDNCTIGEGACIIGDLRIGEGCVVEPNSVLTISLPPRSVAAGIPARIVRRYNDNSRTWEETDTDEALGEFPDRSSSGESTPSF